MLANALQRSERVCEPGWRRSAPRCCVASCSNSIARTFFIATAVAVSHGAAHGADVSHRGGRPGFAQVAPGGELSWPDFQGNNFFNTAGNLVVDSRAGLLFIDFESLDLLHLSGHAEVIWSEPAFDGCTATAQRQFRFAIERHVFRPNGLPLRWSLLEPSPYLSAAAGS